MVWGTTHELAQPSGERGGDHVGDHGGDHAGEHGGDHEGDYHDADVCGCVNHHHRLLQQQPLPRLFPPWRSVLCTSPCGTSAHHQ